MAVYGLMYQSRIQRNHRPRVKLYYLTILSHWFSLTIGIGPQTEGQWKELRDTFRDTLDFQLRKTCRGWENWEKTHGTAGVQLTQLKVRAERREHLLKSLQDNEDTKQGRTAEITVLRQYLFLRKVLILPESNCKITTKPTSGSTINCINSAPILTAL